MFGGRPEHPLTFLAPALTTTTTITSTRLHCRPTVPVPRSSRGPSCSRQPRSGRLFCRSRRQRRHDLTASRRPRFRFVPATERLSLRLLPTTATSLSADVPWLPSSPASRRSTLRSPQQRTGTAAAAALLGRISSSPHTVKQTWCYLTTHPLASPHSTQTSLPLDFPQRCHSLPNTRAFTSTVYSQLFSLAKFLRQPLIHVRFTCTKSPDRHTIDPTGLSRARP